MLNSLFLVSIRNVTKKRSNVKRTLRKSYSIQGKLGRGNFAVVRKVQRRSDGKYFAAKIINNRKLKVRDLDRVGKEVQILKMLNHPNINTMIEAFNTKDHLCIVLQLLEGESLFENVVKKRVYTEKDAANVVLQVARACKYMHDRGIIHRDLKLKNLVYLDKTNEQICVTDFGLSKYMDHTQSKTKTLCGTPAYVAPEVLRQEAYGTEVDMWSLGTILYFLLCGYPPFMERNLQRLYKVIKEGKVVFNKPYWDNISKPAVDCVKGLLNLDMKARLTPSDLLKHPWVSGANASMVNLKQSEGYQKRYKRFSILSKLKLRIATILFLNRLRHLTCVSGLIVEHENKCSIE